VIEYRMPHARVVPLLFRPLSALCLAAMLLGSAVRPAAAHPHVFVTDSVTFVFDAGGRVTALRLDWLFDDFFSAQLFEDFDADGSGSFDDAEVAALRDGAFVSLRDYGWFTHLYLDSVGQESPEPTAFLAIAEGEYVRYRFELPLASPVDPTATRLEVAVYDQEYYVEVLLDEAAPVAFDGAPSACGYTIAEDSAHAYYFDMVYPQMIHLDCGTS
jgi:ABC-type uncharacterized transport system substrate-binding protein